MRIMSVSVLGLGGAPPPNSLDSSTAEFKSLRLMFIGWGVVPCWGSESIGSTAGAEWIALERRLSTPPGRGAELEKYDSVGVNRA